MQPAFLLHSSSRWKANCTTTTCCNPLSLSLILSGKKGTCHFSSSHLNKWTNRTCRQPHTINHHRQSFPSNDSQWRRQPAEATVPPHLNICYNVMQKVAENEIMYCHLQPRIPLTLCQTGGDSTSLPSSHVQLAAKLLRNSNGTWHWNEIVFYSTRRTVTLGIQLLAPHSQ